MRPRSGRGAFTLDDEDTEGPEYLKALQQGPRARERGKGRREAPKVAVSSLVSEQWRECRGLGGSDGA